VESGLSIESGPHFLANLKQVERRVAHILLSKPRRHVVRVNVNAMVKKSEDLGSLYRSVSCSFWVESAYIRLSPGVCHPPNETEQKHNKYENSISKKPGMEPRLCSKAILKSLREQHCASALLSPNHPLSIQEVGEQVSV
jgi:hypothetical protein